MLSSVSLANHLLNLIIILLIIAQPWNNERLAVVSGDMLFIRSAISFAVIIIFIYFLPRKTSIHHPLRFSEKNVNIIRWIDLLMAPLSGMLVRANTALIPSRAQNRHDISVDELSKALGITSDEARGEQEKELLEGIIRFRDKMVGDIFVSRTNMVALDILTPFREVIRFIVDAGYSRIPVYVENADTIKGILYVKDLLPHLDKTGNFNGSHSSDRPTLCRRQNGLMTFWRSFGPKRTIWPSWWMSMEGPPTGHHGGYSKRSGDISDEYDEEQPFFTMTSDGSYLFEGKPSEEFIRLTNLPEKDFESMQEQADTLAGLLLELKGDFPKRKESITYRDHHFVAEEMSKKRITKVRYIPPGKLMKD